MNNARIRIVLLGLLALCWQAGVQGTARELPLRSGERVLFIGNSLTASLPEELNEMFKTNGLQWVAGL